MTSPETPLPRSRVALMALLLLAVLLMGAFLAHSITAMENTGNLACSANPIFNCSKNIGSSFGRIFGIPLSAIATAFFVFLSVHVILSAAPRQVSRTKLYTLPLLLGYCGSAVALYYLLISVFVLHSICLYCSILDALMAVILAISYAGLRTPPSRQPGLFLNALGEFRRSRRTCIQMLVALGFAVTCLISSAPVRIPDLAPFNHAAAEPIAVTEFADFECPACKRVGRELIRLQHDYPGRIAIHFVNYPLCRECNPGVSATLHPNACLAAKIGIALQARGKLDQYCNKIFENNTTLDSNRLYEIAEELGEQKSEIRQQVESDSTLQALKKDIELGRRLDVKSTPTLLLNGKLSQAVTVAEIRAALAPLAVVPAASSSGTNPHIFFTDVISGPNYGGENNNGTILTLYGKNFGGAQGGSTVTIGGGSIARVYEWGVAAMGQTGIQKISVAVGPNARTGAVVVTVNGMASNSDQIFTVRPGGIHCVATTGSDSNDGTFSGGCWKTLPHAKQAMANGDITYALDGVTATTDDYDYSACYTLNTSGTQWGGTLALPKALIGYPGATVTVGNSSSSTAFRGIKTGGADHYVFANLHLLGDGEAIDGSQGVDDLRFVGNDITCPNGNEPNGCVGSGTGGADNNYFLGNYIHDVAKNVSSTVTKLYHSMYIGDGSAHWNIGWNTIANNHANRAIQVYTSSTAISDIQVHDNLIYNSRGIAVLFNSVGLAGSNIYNNVIYHAGVGPDFPDGGVANNCIQIGTSNTGTVGIYNNTIEDCGGVNNSFGPGGAIDLFGAPPTVAFKNNIIYVLSGQNYFDSGSNNSNLTGSANVWFGAGNGPSQTTGNVNADPEFVSLANKDFHLLAGSPAIDSGVNTGIATDFDGITRPQGAAYDIGAYEFYTGSPPPPPQPPAINSFTATPASINAGESSVLTWSISNATSLSIDQGVGSVTGLVSFTVSPSAITTYTLTATNSAGSATRSVTITVNPAPPGQPLLTTQQPVYVNGNDGVDYELGMRFQSDSAGQITAVRFWKSSNETGTHSGKIWSANGALLATVSFSHETASGWQEQALNSPLSIIANTEYMVSVNTGNMYYVADDNGFATEIINGALSSIVGGNGRYGPPGQYPTQTYQSSNYFRDVRFAASVNSPPVITSAAVASPAATFAGQALNFKVAASDSDSDTLTYSWNFGDGATGSGASASHSYSAAGTYTAVATVSDGHGNSVSSSVTITVTAATAMRINSGGAASGSFAADTSFTGGYKYSTTHTINTASVTSPAPQAVYQTERYGNFTYTVGGLAAGAPYTVRLHFAEIYWSSSGQRIFNVAINGQQVIANFDIFATAGGNFKAVVREFSANADGNGQITIAYTTIKDNAKSSGIEVLTPSSGATLSKYGSAVTRDTAGDPNADPSLVISSIDLGSVQVGKPFKMKLELPESGKAATKLHWKAVNTSQLPAGVRASGAYVGGKTKTAGTFTFQLEFQSADKRMISNTYSLTVTP